MIYCTLAALVLPYLFVAAGLGAEAAEVHEYVSQRFLATEEASVSYNFIMNQEENALYWQVEFTKAPLKQKTKLGLQIVDVDENLDVATISQFDDRSFNRIADKEEIGLLEKEMNIVGKKQTQTFIFKTAIKKAQDVYRLGVRLIGSELDEKTGESKTIDFHSAGKVTEMKANASLKVKPMALDELLPKDFSATPISHSQLQLYQDAQWKDYSQLKSAPKLDDATPVRIFQEMDMTKFFENAAIKQAVGAAEAQANLEGKEAQFSYSFAFTVDRKISLETVEEHTNYPIRVDGQEDMIYGYYSLQKNKGADGNHLWVVTLNHNAFKREGLKLMMGLETTVDVNNTSETDTLILRKNGEKETAVKIHTASVGFFIGETAQENQTFEYVESLQGIPVVWETTVTPHKDENDQYSQIEELTMSSNDVTKAYAGSQKEGGHAFTFIFNNETAKQELAKRNLPIFEIKAYDESGKEVPVPKFDRVSDGKNAKSASLIFHEPVQARLVIRTTTVTRPTHITKGVTNQVTATSKNAGNAEASKTITVGEHRVYLESKNTRKGQFDWDLYYYRNQEAKGQTSQTEQPNQEVLTVTLTSGEIDPDSLKLVDENGAEGNTVASDLYQAEVQGQQLKLTFYDFAKEGDERLADGRYRITFRSEDTDDSQVTGKVASSQKISCQSTAKQKMTIQAEAEDLSTATRQAKWLVESETINTPGPIDFYLLQENGGEHFFYQEAPAADKEQPGDILVQKSGLVVAAEDENGKLVNLSEDEYELTLSNQETLSSEYWSGKKAGIHLRIKDQKGHNPYAGSKLTVYLLSQIGEEKDLIPTPVNDNHFTLQTILVQGKEAVKSTAKATIDDENYLNNVVTQGALDEVGQKVNWTIFANTRMYDIRQGQIITNTLNKKRQLESADAKYHYLTEKDLQDLRVYKITPDPKNKVNDLFKGNHKELLTKTAYRIKKTDNLKGTKHYKGFEIEFLQDIGTAGIGIEFSSDYDLSAQDSQQQASASYMFTNQVAFTIGDCQYSKEEQEFYLLRDRYLSQEVFFNEEDSTASWEMVVNAEGDKLDEVVLESAPLQGQNVEMSNVEVFHTAIIDGEYMPGKELDNSKRLYEVRLNTNDGFQNGFKLAFRKTLDYPIFVRYKTAVKQDVQEIKAKTKLSWENGKQSATVDRSLKVRSLAETKASPNRYAVNIANLVKGPSSPIKNSEFRLERKVDGKWQTVGGEKGIYRTNVHGIANALQLVKGEYRLTEMKVEGFVLTNDALVFQVPYQGGAAQGENGSDLSEDYVVSGQGDLVNVTVYDSMKPFDLEIVNKDHHGREVKGGRLHVSNGQGTVRRNIPTKEGQEISEFVVKDLGAGIYTLKELRPPAGFEPMKSEVMIDIANTGVVNIKGDNTSLDFIGGYHDKKSGKSSFIKLTSGTQHNKIKIEIINRPLSEGLTSDEKVMRQGFFIGAAAVMAIDQVTGVYYICGNRPIRIIEKKEADQDV